MGRTWRSIYEKNVPHYSALVRFRYPDFVYRRLQDLGEQVPVFVFHSVTPAAFEDQLRYLSENSYRSLRADEFVAVLKRDAPCPPRSVVLTFDDGLGSLWAVAHPLLRKYGHVAVAFVIARLVPEGSRGPTLEDVWRGAARADTIAAREQGEQPLATWSELREMAEVGTADIQCHTWNHDRVFISPNVVGFVRPDFDYWFFGRIHLPVYIEAGKENLERVAPLGTPVYEFLPRFAAPQRFFDDEALRASCAALVARRGGPAFFQEANWEHTLRAHLRAYRRDHRVEERYATGREVREGMRRDLYQARQTLEARLERPVHHLCYPWYRGSEGAVALSRELGYHSNFWGALPGRRSNRPGDDPFRVARLPDEYIYCLPGHGRKRLGTILREKLGRYGAPFLRRLHAGS